MICLTLPEENSKFGPFLRRRSVRCLMKVTIPVAEGNAAVANGSLASTINSILGDLKPEAAYFAEENGARTAFLFVNMENSSQIPALAEPWFLAFNAKVELHPAMNLEDLKNAAPGIENAVRKYARAARAIGRHKFPPPATISC